jgi:EF hand
MKRIAPLLLLPGLLFSSTNADAKGKKDDRSSGTYGCAKFDANQNGVLDPDEIVALRKAFAEGDSALKPLDTNNDGKLDDSEIALVKLPQPEKGKRKKPNT